MGLDQGPALRPLYASISLSHRYILTRFWLPYIKSSSHSGVFQFPRKRKIVEDSVLVVSERV